MNTDWEQQPGCGPARPGPPAQAAPARPLDPQQLQAYQASALRQLRDHAYARSPFYRRFHAGRTDHPLHELPVLTKAMVMEHFDELVTDPAVRLAEVEAHLAALEDNQRYRGRYWVAATSGTTGRRGIFLWDLDEWVTVLASYNRSLDWAGATADLTRRLPMAVVSSTTPWHQSARVGATVRSPWVQTLRLRCPCDRPFALIEGIQGRVEEALSFPARSGGQVTVRPAVVHGVMDGVPAEGWQLVQEPERLAVLLAGVPHAFDDDALADRLRRELRSRGALPPPVHVQRVRAIPRTALGKAPLITRST